MHPFGLVFLVLLAGAAAARWWLADRQLRHLSATAGDVPEPFRDAVTPEDHRRAAAYARSRVRAGRTEQLAQALLVAVLTVGGGVGALAGLGRSLDLPPWTVGTSLILAVAGLRGLVEVPFAAYRTFGIEARFGYNRATPGLFLVDLLRGAILSAVLGGLLAAAILLLMGKAGALWWVYAGAVWVAFSLGLTWVGPRWIAPLFNNFRPLEDGELRRRIGDLLGRCGLTVAAVLVMDASRRTAHGNAYFSGLGSAKRVVLFDTLLDSLTPAEAEAVLAHELGHYRLGHIRRGLVLSALAGVAGLALLAGLRGQGWLYHGLGVAEPGDGALLALALLIAPVFAFPLRPLLAAWSRRREREADAFALRHCPAPDLARALTKLFRDNAAPLEPDPLYARVYYSHPPPVERLARLQAS